MTDLTLEQALTELGLDLDADPAEVRHAYLRLLRQHRPERDPKGFMQLRRAYEIARDALGWRQRWPSELPQEQVQVPETAPLVDHGEAGPLVSELERGPAAEQLDPAPPIEPPAPHLVEPASASADAENEVDFSRYFARLDAVPTEAVTQRLAIAREAVERWPNESMAYWMLVGELETAGAPYADERVATIKEGARRGLPGFLHQLMAAAPAALSEEQIAELERSSLGQTGVALQLAAALVERGAISKAGELAEREIERHIAGTADLDAASLGVGEVQVILAMLARDELAAAAQLAKRLEAALQLTGAELSASRGSGGLRWVLTCQLATVAARLPEAVRLGLAAGIRATSFEGDELERLRAYIQRRERRMRELAGEIWGEAPNLAELLTQMATQQPAAPPGRRPLWGNVGPSWGIVVFAVALVSSMGRMCIEPRGREAGRDPRLPIPPTTQVLRVEKYLDQLCAIAEGRQPADGGSPPADTGPAGSSRPAPCRAAAAFRAGDACAAATEITDWRRRESAAGPGRDDQVLLGATIEWHLTQKCTGTSGSAIPPAPEEKAP